MSDFSGFFHGGPFAPGYHLLKFLLKCPLPTKQGAGIKYLQNPEGLRSNSAFGFSEVAIMPVI